MLSDGLGAGEMHTAAAGGAEPGEELGDAHDASAVQGSRAPKACPWITEGAMMGSDENRRPDRSETGSLGRAATCDGLSHGDGFGVERPCEVSPVLGWGLSNLTAALH